MPIFISLQRKSKAAPDAAKKKQGRKCTFCFRPCSLLGLK